MGVEMALTAWSWIIGKYRRRTDKNITFGDYSLP